MEPEAHGFYKTGCPASPRIKGIIPPGFLVWEREDPTEVPILAWQALSQLSHLLSPAGMFFIRSPVSSDNLNYKQEWWRLCWTISIFPFHLPVYSHQTPHLQMLLSVLNAQRICCPWGMYSSGQTWGQLQNSVTSTQAQSSHRGDISVGHQRGWIPVEEGCTKEPTFRFLLGTHCCASLDHQREGNSFAGLWRASDCASN